MKGIKASAKEAKVVKGKYLTDSSAKSVKSWAKKTVKLWSGSFREDTIMRRRMLRLLVLIPEKKSLHLAQKAMNCRNIEKIMDSFAKINLSPVTISKRHDVKYLECLYAYLLDEE